MKPRFFFCFPFQSKRSPRFTWIFLMLLVLCFGIKAADDVQQLEDTRQLAKQAEKLIRKGNLIEAEEILRQIIKQNPADTKSKLNLSYVLLKGRKLFEAYEIALEVAKAEPKNARAFALLGTTMLNFGNFKDAQVLLKNSYALDKEEPLAWFGAGMLDFYENRIYDSFPKLQQAEALESTEPDFV